MNNQPNKYQYPPEVYGKNKQEESEEIIKDPTPIDQGFPEMKNIKKAYSVSMEILEFFESRFKQQEIKLQTQRQKLQQQFELKLQTQQKRVQQQFELKLQTQQQRVQQQFELKLQTQGQKLQQQEELLSEMKQELDSLKILNKVRGVGKHGMEKAKELHEKMSEFEMTGYIEGKEKPNLCFYFVDVVNSTSLTINDKSIPNRIFRAKNNVLKEIYSKKYTERNFECYFVGNLGDGLFFVLNEKAIKNKQGIIDFTNIIYKIFSKEKLNIRCGFNVGNDYEEYRLLIEERLNYIGKDVNEASRIEASPKIISNKEKQNQLFEQFIKRKWELCKNGDLDLLTELRKFLSEISPSEKKSVLSFKKDCFHFLNNEKMNYKEKKVNLKGIGDLIVCTIILPLI